MCVCSFIHENRGFVIFVDFCLIFFFFDLKESKRLNAWSVDLALLKHMSHHCEGPDLTSGHVPWGGWHVQQQSTRHKEVKHVICVSLELASHQ